MKEPPSRRVTIHGLPRAAAIPRARLQKLLLDVMASERASEGTLHLEFVSDEAMRRVNAGYRGKDATTDVLSFNYRDEPHAGDLLGEVMISLAVARKQAREHRVPLAEEVARLALHGLLHVLGYDHETSARDYKRMIGLQEKYMTALWKSAPRPAAASPRRRRARPAETARC